MKQYLDIFKITIFILFATMCFMPAWAQNSLSGVIRDKADTSTLGAAQVYITDLKRAASSDINGAYVFKDLPAGRFIIEVHLVGYATKTMTVNVKGNTRQDILLEATQVELNQVVVTGVSHATEIKRNPVPITVIDNKYLATALSTNIIDAIAQIPGVSQVTTGPNVSKPIIRGLGYNRILTLYDGIRQEGQQWGDEHGIEIDQNLVDKIEVVKGPASLTYGSDAMAGVINMLPAQPVPDGKILGSVLENYQSNNGLYSESVNLAGSKKGINWSARVSRKDATNYQDPVDGRVYGTAYKETDAAGTFGLQKKWGFSNFSFSVFDDLQEIPDGSRDSASRKFTKQIYDGNFDTMNRRPIVSPQELSSYSIATLHQHVQHYRLYSTNSFEAGAGRITANIGYQQSIRREYDLPEQPDIPGLYLLLQTVTYDIKYSFPESNGWEPTVGVNGMYQVNQSKGTEYIIPSYNLFDVGPFAFISKAYKKLNISGGLRYDNRYFNNQQMYVSTDPATGEETPVNPTALRAEPKFQQYSHNFGGASGSIGATYNFSDNFSLKANVSRGFRAPNIAEISANGVHPGTNIYQIGNLNLNPEFSLQEDIGLFFSSRHVSFSAEIFHNNISNYIFNEKILNRKGGDSVIIPGNQTFEFVQTNAELYGGEFNLDIHPHPLDWLHFENSLSIVYGQNLGTNGKLPTDSAKYLPQISPPHTRSELRATAKKIHGPFANAFCMVQVLYYAAQNRAFLAYNTETPTPAYTLLNAGFGADIVNKKGQTILTLDILGENLANVAYQDALSRLKYFEEYPTYPGPQGIYNMGRNISLKLIIPIDVR